MDRLFSTMLDNFIQARETRPGNEKSAHWDVFPADYEKAIANRQAWPGFLRNSLSLGFNDDLNELDNLRWEKNGADATAIRKGHDYTPLIGASVTDEKRKKIMLKIAEHLAASCGLDFLLRYTASGVGSPATLPLTITRAGQAPINLYINYHDLFVVYYFFQILKVFKENNSSTTPMVVEIGGGSGSLMAKMKRAYPQAKCVLLDLPELSAVQTYYLNMEFPDKKFLYYGDWLKEGAALFDDEFDFLIAPGWMIDKIPDTTVDMVVNMRSMMEMTNAMIAFYFDAIHRITGPSGIFACINRYLKTSSGEHIMLKNYPFDNHWQVLSSQRSIMQNHIHELIVQRQPGEVTVPVADVLRGLPAQ